MTEASHVVQDYTVARLRTLAGQYDRKLAALRTRADALKLVRESQRKLKRVFGRFPDRTPLNVSVNRTLERRGYRIEMLTYESRPRFFVTANLYMPSGGGPFPAVLQPCGHAQNGKAYKGYQALGHGLARQGYAVLIYDPVSQGERSHQYRGDDGLDALLDCCREHNLAGNQMSLIGDFFGTWRLWDGMRSLDVLLSRPEVDRDRVGVTGSSGGGTLSTYLNALDDRITMAAPSCFVTTFLCNLENELPADAEQIPPGLLAAGLDMADFFIAAAPRPTLLLGQDHDYFDMRGTQQTFRRIRKVYRLLGKPHHIQLHIGQGRHSFDRRAREACGAFFNRHAGISRSGREGSIELVRDEDLCATLDGNVLELAGARRTCDFTREAAAATADRRVRISAGRLPKVLTKVLNLPARKAPPHYRTLRPMGGEDPALTAFAKVWLFGLETVTDFHGQTAVLQHWVRRDASKGAHPYRAHPTPEGRIVVYVPHICGRGDVTEGQVPEAWPEFWSVDVRGMGRDVAMTGDSRDFFEAFGADYLHASHAQLLGENYLGWRTHDLLAALDLLQSQGAERIHLVGRGLGALLATFAAVVHPAVKQVSLQNALLSYRELTECPVYAWPASAMPWGGLRHFDLPDCYRALRRRKLKISKPWNALMKPWSDAKALARHVKDLGLEWI